MDTGRPDDDSSSPNAERIVRIQLEGAGGEVVRIDLSDGSSFLLPYETTQSERLETGLELTEDLADRLSRESDRLAASRKALDLLALREQPRARLEIKLRSRGFSIDAIRTALDDLEANGRLDDLRFAELWVSAKRRRNPCGRARLYAGLLNQGVTRSVAVEALRQWSDEDEADALRRAAERLLGRGGTSRERVLRSLAAKGFSLAAAERSLDELAEDQ